VTQYTDPFHGKVSNTKLINVALCIFAGAAVAAFVLVNAVEPTVNALAGMARSADISLMAKEFEAKCLVNLKNNPHRFDACIEAANKFATEQRDLEKKRTRNY
jgi:hypothetical protein